MLYGWVRQVGDVPVVYLVEIQPGLQQGFGGERSEEGRPAR